MGMKRTTTKAWKRTTDENGRIIHHHVSGAWIEVGHTVAIAHPKHASVVYNNGIEARLFAPNGKQVLIRQRVKDAKEFCEIFAKSDWILTDCITGKTIDYR
jgi:hypothetical protein